MINLPLKFEDRVTTDSDPTTVLTATTELKSDDEEPHIKIEGIEDLPPTDTAHSHSHNHTHTDRKSNAERPRSDPDLLEKLARSLEASLCSSSKLNHGRTAADHIGGSSNVSWGAKAGASELPAMDITEAREATEARKRKAPPEILCDVKTAKMDHSVQAHVIDPEGEVTFVLKHANRPFAVWKDENGEPLPEERTSVSEEWEPEGRPRVGHYRVSEKHMKFASVMFNRFLEAQRPLKKVIIRGFDSEALLIVLSVIHGRFDKVPRKVTLELLARIYAVVEYLDCRDALSFCFDMWLPQIRKDMPYLRFSRDLTLWLWLSYELRLEDDWQTAATKVICQSPGPVSSLKLPFPSNVLGQLNEWRETVIQGIIDMVYDQFSRYLNGSRGCSRFCNASILGILLMRLHASGLFPEKPKAPFQGMRYDSLLSVWDFQPLDYEDPKKRCRCYLDCFLKVEHSLDKLTDGIRPVL